uniref:Uncharacterized protein n=1 Tax=Arundo donax TaxID=35708 RepID=A0A0A9B5Q1_ARUDO
MPNQKVWFHQTPLVSTTNLEFTNNSHQMIFATVSFKV